MKLEQTTDSQTQDDQFVAPKPHSCAESTGEIQAEVTMWRVFR